MNEEESKVSNSSILRRIATQFSHLLSAQLVETVLSGIFFLYVAWLDSNLYGEIMYSFAVGVMTLRVVQFGLYYRQVTDLTGSSREDAAEIIFRVSCIKAALLGPCLLVLGGLAWYRGFSTQMTAILFLVSLGFALEAFPDSVFADFRVRGAQRREARIKAYGSASGFGFGIVAAVTGLHPVFVGLFRIISSAVRIGLAGRAYIAEYPLTATRIPTLHKLYQTARGAVVFALIDILTNIYTRTNLLFLESSSGTQGVAFYSATWLIVDSVSWLTAELLLGWVVFPVLATLWISGKDQFSHLVRNAGLWLVAIALPIMFVLSAESDLIIGLAFPKGYSEAVWMQRYLVWTILFSFVQYLFAYVIMVIGAARVLLTFSVLAMALNLILNVTLVGPFGLLGGCLVIIFTKMVMALMTFTYCQARFRFFRAGDLVYLLGLSVVSLGMFALVEGIVGHHAAVAGSVVFYTASLLLLRKRFIGSPHRGNIA
jgi:O-antigen/teichoic acid export membrane protein